MAVILDTPGVTISKVISMIEIVTPGISRTNDAKSPVHLDRTDVEIPIVQ